MNGETEALRQLILAGKTAQGEPISKLGYFCAPFRPAEGPFSDKVIKVYRSDASAADLARLETAHTQYVEILLHCGVDLPETQFQLLELEGRNVPVIVQQALPADSMMRPLMIDADRDAALRMMQAAGEVIAGFWAKAALQDARVGFHPSIRNLAIIDGKAVFFDTFPPLIGYSREEMGALLLTYSASPLMRAIGPLMKGRITAIQDEWYAPPETLVGLVGSACRLRPDDAEAFLDWGRGFVREAMPDHADAALDGLRDAPRLPIYWTAWRKIMGLQGEPNV